MRNILRFLFYTFVFSAVSLFFSQLTYLIHDEVLFQDREEMALSLTTGLVCAIIVSFYTTEKNKNEI